MYKSNACYGPTHRTGGEHPGNSSVRLPSHVITQSTMYEKLLDALLQNPPIFYLLALALAHTAFILTLTYFFLPGTYTYKKLLLAPATFLHAK